MWAMTDCVECEQSDKTARIVQHHTNYQTDSTVPVCDACHQRIHADQSHPLYPVGEPDETSLRISNTMADELFDRKRRGESYEDVIWQLIELTDD